MDSQLLTMLRKAAAAQGGSGFALRFTGLSLLCAVLFGILLTPLARNRAAEDSDTQHSTSTSASVTGTQELAPSSVAPRLTEVTDENTRH